LIVVPSPAGSGALVTCETFGLVTISPGGGMPAAWADLADTAGVSIVARYATVTNVRPILREANTLAHPEDRMRI
jgi:hypothetical protein